MKREPYTKREKVRNYWAAKTHVHCGHQGRCCLCGWWTVPPSHPTRRANPSAADEPPPVHEDKGGAA